MNWRTTTPRTRAINFLALVPYLWLCSMGLFSPLAEFPLLYILYVFGSLVALVYPVARTLNALHRIKKYQALYREGYASFDSRVQSFVSNDKSYNFGNPYFLLLVGAPAVCVLFAIFASLYGFNALTLTVGSVLFVTFAVPSALTIGFSVLISPVYYVLISGEAWELSNIAEDAYPRMLKRKAKHDKAMLQFGSINNKVS